MAQNYYCGNGDSEVLIWPSYRHKVEVLPIPTGLDITDTTWWWIINKVVIASQK